MREPRTSRAGDHALQVTGVTKRYGALAANDDVDLTIDAGEIVALLGENGAGKSTLVKVLAGIVTPDAGGVRVAGREVRLGDPVRSRGAGVGVVHQHFMLVPGMTVAENVALSRGRGGRWALRLSELSAQIDELGESFGLHVDPTAPVESLPVGERQRVEIVKTLSLRPQVLVLDEPSAVLTPEEWTRLAHVLRGLAASGYAILLITHKLAEIADVAQRCVVMRGGRVVGDVPVASTPSAVLAELMVGRAVNLQPHRADVEPGGPVLRVHDLRLERFRGERTLGPIDLEVAAGEVLGIAGVEGNGQTEVAELIAGQRAPTTGTVEVRRRDGSPRGTVGVIAEDRHKDGLALTLSVQDNLMMRTVAEPRFQRWGIVRGRSVRDHCAALARRFDIRTPDVAEQVGRLSGGNQQKVVLARELESQPDLLVASQPTRGLDVGAIEFVHAQINDHKRRRGATVLISAELDEVLGLSDRVAVLSDGVLAGVLPASEATREAVGHLMAGAGSSPASGAL